MVWLHHICSSTAHYIYKFSQLYDGDLIVLKVWWSKIIPFFESFRLCLVLEKCEGKKLEKESEEKKKNLNQ